ncbi:alpha-L-fucosidase [Microbacterium awajiense]|uniref:alpha-L-fucosidase n=1 Tax=Microbacterium awajiense TaxID=415214 RepID=UPI0031D5E6BC
MVDTDKRDYVHTRFAQRADAASNPALAWFREARFGMFVHWGLYALPAGTWQGQPTPHMGEWIMHDLEIPAADYRRLADDFDPQSFDAGELVDLAVRAGQRYIVVTAKHHDGFCLWGTEQTEFNSVTGTPFGRDIIGEISRACSERGVAFGLYYSQTQDWTHPDAAGNDWDFDPETKDFEGYLQTYVKPQLTELLTGYGPIALIWFDTPLGISAEQSKDLVDHVHALQPDCLVNGRVGNGLGDYGQTADNDMPDAPPGDWETPITGNSTWGYMAGRDDWKSAREIAATVAEAASLGGNVLLNVGPDAQGRIPDGQRAQLAALGEWMDRCGRAIRGTTRGPFTGLDGAWSTEDADRVYLHLREWPPTGEFALSCDTRFASASLLTNAGGESVPMRVEGDWIVLDLRACRPDPVLSVIELERVERGEC